MDVLKGIRVLEVAEWGFVPSAGTVLADWGAELIKIEHPVRGDPIRGLVNAGVIPGARGVNFFVEHLGRNKRSVGIDFNQPAGRDLLYKLVKRCDVFLTNFLPPARERLGITYADLRKLKADLIYAKGHGQGQRGPDADRGGYDGLSFWARGGIGDRITPSGMPLLQQRAAFGDFTGGMFIAGGIAAALFHRERTGEGLEVDVSLLGNAVWVLAPDIVAAMAYGFELPRAGEMPGVPNALVNTYPCADGRQLVLMMLQHDRYWPIFCKAVRREDWLADPRFNPDPVRAKNQADLVAELKAMFAAQPRIGVHLGAGPVAARGGRGPAGRGEPLHPRRRAARRREGARVGEPGAVQRRAARGAQRRSGRRRGHRGRAPRDGLHLGGSRRLEGSRDHLLSWPPLRPAVLFRGSDVAQCPRARVARARRPRRAIAAASEKPGTIARSCAADPGNRVVRILLTGQARDQPPRRCR